MSPRRSPNDAPQEGRPEPAQDARPRLFEPVAPFEQGELAVGDGHRVHYEQCGRPDGLPVVFLHGGPGSGCNARHRQLLDPARFRVVLFDQRGCGRSTPRGATGANTTAHLIADIERLRTHLGIERWLVFGGSWGSSLGLAYCAQHPAACLGALLRGIFLTGRADIDWFFRGAGALLPEAWQQFVAPLSPAAREDVATHYLDAARSPDEARAGAAIARWMAWESALSATDGQSPPVAALAGEALQLALDKYRVQAHYLAHECFIGEAAALRLAAAMHGVPAAILHGPQDRICRPANALRLHRALVGSRIRLVAGAGHSPFDAAMTAALIDAAEYFHESRDFHGWGEDMSGSGAPRV